VDLYSGRLECASGTLRIPTPHQLPRKFDYNLQRAPNLARSYSLPQRKRGYQSMRQRSAPPPIDGRMTLPLQHNCFGYSSQTRSALVSPKEGHVNGHFLDNKQKWPELTAQPVEQQVSGRNTLHVTVASELGFKSDESVNQQNLGDSALFPPMSFGGVLPYDGLSPGSSHAMASHVKEDGGVPECKSVFEFLSLDAVRRKRKADYLASEKYASEAAYAQAAKRATKRSRSASRRQRCSDSEVRRILNHQTRPLRSSDEIYR
jgi:hypothetical protein